MNELNGNQSRWYQGISAYYWLVLAIASLGWVFDIFEGQIFVASMPEAMPSLLPSGTLSGTIARYNNIALAAYLAGGALGGVLFGAVSDRIGRTRTMILTILMYSLLRWLRHLLPRTVPDAVARDGRRILFQRRPAVSRIHHFRQRVDAGRKRAGAVPAEFRIDAQPVVPRGCVFADLCTGNERAGSADLRCAAMVVQVGAIEGT